jgi:hypothetical protein
MPQKLILPMKTVELSPIVVTGCLSQEIPQLMTIGKDRYLQ